MLWENKLILNLITVITYNSLKNNIQVGSLFTWHMIELAEFHGVITKIS